MHPHQRSRRAAAIFWRCYAAAIVLAALLVWAGVTA